MIYQRTATSNGRGHEFTERKELDGFRGRIPVHELPNNVVRLPELGVDGPIPELDSVKPDQGEGEVADASLRSDISRGG